MQILLVLQYLYFTNYNVHTGTAGKHMMNPTAPPHKTPYYTFYTLFLLFLSACTMSCCNNTFPQYGSMKSILSDDAMFMNEPQNVRGLILRNRT